MLHLDDDMLGRSVAEPEVGPALQAVPALVVHLGFRRRITADEAAVRGDGARMASGSNTRVSAAVLCQVCVRRKCLIIFLNLIEKANSLEERERERIPREALDS